MLTNRYHNKNDILVRVYLNTTDISVYKLEFDFEIITQISLSYVYVRDYHI